MDFKTVYEERLEVLRRMSSSIRKMQAFLQENKSEPAARKRLHVLKFEKACNAYVIQLNSLAVYCLANSQQKESFNLLTEAKKLCKPEWGKACIDLRILTLNNISCYLRYVGKPQDALATLRSACKLGKRTFTDSEHIPITYMNLAALCSTMGRHEASFKEAQVGISLAERTIKHLSKGNTVAMNSMPLLDRQKYKNMQIALKIGHYNAAVEAEYLGQPNVSKRHFAKARGILSRTLTWVLEYALCPTMEQSASDIFSTQRTWKSKDIEIAALWPLEQRDCVNLEIFSPWKHSPKNASSVSPSSKQQREPVHIVASPGERPHLTPAKLSPKSWFDSEDEQEEPISKSTTPMGLKKKKQMKKKKTLTTSSKKSNKKSKQVAESPVQVKSTTRPNSAVTRKRPKTAGRQRPSSAVSRPAFGTRRSNISPSGKQARSRSVSPRAKATSPKQSMSPKHRTANKRVATSPKPRGKTRNVTPRKTKKSGKELMAKITPRHHAKRQQKQDKKPLEQEAKPVSARKKTSKANSVPSSDEKKRKKTKATQQGSLDESATHDLLYSGGNLDDISLRESQISGIGSVDFMQVPHPLRKPPNARDPNYATTASQSKPTAAQTQLQPKQEAGPRQVEEQAVRKPAPPVPLGPLPPLIRAQYEAPTTAHSIPTAPQGMQPPPLQYSGRLALSKSVDNTNSLEKEEEDDLEESDALPNSPPPSLEFEAVPEIPGITAAHIEQSLTALSRPPGANLEEESSHSTLVSSDVFSSQDELDFSDFSRCSEVSTEFAPTSRKVEQTPGQQEQPQVQQHDQYDNKVKHGEHSVRSSSQSSMSSSFSSAPDGNGKSMAGSEATTSTFSESPAQSRTSSEASMSDFSSVQVDPRQQENEQNQDEKEGKDVKQQQAPNEDRPVPVTRFVPDAESLRSYSDSDSDSDSNASKDSDDSEDEDQGVEQRGSKAENENDNASIAGFVGEDDGDEEAENEQNELAGLGVLLSKEDSQAISETRSQILSENSFPARPYELLKQQRNDKASLSSAYDDDSDAVNQVISNSANAKPEQFVPKETHVEDEDARIEEQNSVYGAGSDESSSCSSFSEDQSEAMSASQQGGDSQASASCSSFSDEQLERFSSSQGDSGSSLQQSSFSMSSFSQ